MNENELTQIEIDILDKMCLDNEEDKKFKEWYKNKNKNNNNMENHIKNESLIFEKYIMEEEIKKEDNSIPNNRLPNRANEKYTRIENYEDYEFTHCIAYEMAIRNKEVIKLTDLMEKLNLLRYNILQNFNSLQNYEEKIVQLSLLIDFLIKSIKINYKDPLKSIFEIHNRLSKNMNLDNTEIVTDIFLEILDTYENSYLLTILNNYSATYNDSFQSKYNENNLKDLFKKASQEDKFCLISLLLISTQTKLEKEYYIVNEHKSIKPKFIEEFISKDTNYEETSEINNHIDTIFTDPNYKEKYIHEERSGYTAYQGTYENDNSFTINKVIPNFAQPLRMFNTMSISINPSLPLNDILSFVKKIKEDYDTKCDFKSFFELSMKDLIVDSNTRNTIDNATSYNKEKWADLFYIYDYFQFYFSEGNKINKGKNENGKANKEDDSTTVAKEISLQLSFYHILGQIEPLDFSEFADIDNYESAYNEYEMDLFYKIKEKIEENKEYEKYIKPKNGKDEKKEETINFYMTADHIKTNYYSKMKKLIEGKTPEYIKLVNGKNHTLNSFISGKNNISNNL